jgi:hypothetical protein
MKFELFHHVFECIEDFARMAEQSECGPVHMGGWSGGVNTVEEAAQLAYTGWDAGAQRAQQLRLEVRDRIESLGIEGMDAVESYDVSGAYVDVGAYCEGEPECMVDFEEKLMPRQRVAKMFVQINYNGGMDVPEIERRGVALSAVVDALEGHGMQCEVWAVDWVHTRYYNVTSTAMPDDPWPSVKRHAICVKKAGQLLPLDRIAYMLGHPSAFRGLLAAARYHLHGFTFGSARPMSSEMKETNEMYFPCPDSGEPQWRSDDAAMDWAVETVDKFVTEVTA